MTANLSLLTSVNAVLEALTECDELGRDDFLKKYGYAYSRKYPLHHNGKRMTQRPLSVWHMESRTGLPLRAKEFSGGVATVIPTLLRLGFIVTETPHPALRLVKGQIYFRTFLLTYSAASCSLESGRQKSSPQYFYFPGDSGEGYGYHDGLGGRCLRILWRGQIGDMTFTGGNKAIRDHRNYGKDLLLFKDLGKGKGVRYEGLFECASWRDVQGPDKNKNIRKIIQFDLVPVGSAAIEMEADALPAPVPTKSLTLDQLREAALTAASSPTTQSEPSEARRVWRERSAKVRAYVLARAGGTCESCDQEAPFIKKDGAPYLEPHHTTRLADDGPDHPAWVAAICPNCHRRVHSGQDGESWEQEDPTKTESD